MNSTGFTKNDSLKAKGIAIILLCFHHLFSTTNYIESWNIRIPDFLTLDSFVRMGSMARVCVWIFVFISAYGLTVKYLSKDYSTPLFLYRQWWSLMRSYWFFYITFFLLSFFLFKSFIEIFNGNWLHIGLDFLALGDLFGTKMRYGLFWYMSFAQVLLLMMPLMIEFSKKVGIFSIPITFIITHALGNGFASKYGGTYLNYIYTAQMAILCVQYRVFEKVGTKHHSIRSVFEAFALLLVFVVLSDLKITLVDTEIKSFSYFIIGIAVVALCVFVKKYTATPVIDTVLAYLGKHSGNMFLIHAVLYSNYPKIVFATKSVILSVVILVVFSLCVSIVLEWLKKILHYNQGINKLSNWFLHWSQTNS